MNTFILQFLLDIRDFEYLSSKFRSIKDGLDRLCLARPIVQGSSGVFHLLLSEYSLFDVYFLQR